MRFPISILSLLLFLAACSNIEQHRPMVEATTKDWNDVQTELNQFMKHITQEIDTWTAMYQEVVVYPEDRDKLTGEESDMVDNLSYECKSQGEAYNSLYAAAEMEIAKVVNLKADIEKLEKGLESGKLPKDHAATINKIEDQVKASRAAIEAWEKQLTAGKSAFQQNYEQLKSLLQKGD